MKEIMLVTKDGLRSIRRSKVRGIRVIPREHLKMPSVVWGDLAKEDEYFDFGEFLTVEEARAFADHLNMQMVEE